MSRETTFEKQMERLQKVVEELERADLPLEKTVLLYKEGRVLAANCRKQLEQARLAVTVRDGGGVSPFEGENAREEPE